MVRLRGAITAGILRAGDPLRPVADLAKQYRVGSSTAHRAMAQLTDAGLVITSRGKRAVVAYSRTLEATATVVDINSRGAGA